MIFLKGIFLKQKEEFDSEFILCPVSNFNRDTYLNLRLLLRTLLSIPFALCLGYALYYNIETVNDIKHIILSIVLGYIISFYLLQIPHEFIHYLIYSRFIDNKEVKVKTLNRKRIFTTVYNNTLPLYIIIIGLLTPILLITTLLIVFLFLYGFNIIIYSILWAHLILSSEDILNFFITLTKTKSDIGLFEIPNDYNYIIKKQDE